MPSRIKACKDAVIANWVLVGVSPEHAATAMLRGSGAVDWLMENGALDGLSSGTKAEE